MVLCFQSAYPPGLSTAGQGSRGFDLGLQVSFSPLALRNRSRNPGQRYLKFGRDAFQPASQTMAHTGNGTEWSVPPASHSRVGTPRKSDAVERVPTRKGQHSFINSALLYCNRK